MQNIKTIILFTSNFKCVFVCFSYNLLQQTECLDVFTNIVSTVFALMSQLSLLKNERYTQSMINTFKTEFFLIPHPAEKISTLHTDWV